MDIETFSKTVCGFIGKKFDKDDLNRWFSLTIDFNDNDIIAAIKDIGQTEKRITSDINIAALITERCRRTLSYDYIYRQLLTCTNYDDLTHISAGLRTLAYNNNLLDPGMDMRTRTFLSKDLAARFLDDNEPGTKKKHAGDKYGSGLSPDFPMPRVIMDNGDLVPVNEWDAYDAQRGLPMPETEEEVAMTMEALGRVAKGLDKETVFDGALTMIIGRMK